MELRQLTYFEAVARRTSFTQAAAEVAVAQPAVSAQVRSLEKELGVRLLDRTTRSVQLTHAGQEALPRVRAILAAVEDFRAEMLTVRGTSTAALRLGAATALGPVDLAQALAGFRRGHPGVRLIVRSGFMPDLVARVEQEDLDLALGPLPEDLPPRLATTVVARESIVLITPAGEPHTPARSLRDVREEQFVSLPRGSRLHTILVQACRRDGFEPAVTVEAPDPATLRAYVSAGLGVGIVARSDALRAGPAVHLVDIGAAAAHPPIGVVHRAAHPAIAMLTALRTTLIAAVR